MNSRAKIARALRPSAFFSSTLKAVPNLRRSRPLNAPACRAASKKAKSSSRFLIRPERAAALWKFRYLYASEKGGTEWAEEYVAQANADIERFLENN